MPIAAIGPRLLFELRSENSRHSSARMTVVPEATIGSRRARQARPMAAHRDGTRSQSLPVAGDQQQRIVGGGADDKDATGCPGFARSA